MSCISAFYLKLILFPTIVEDFHHSVYCFNEIAFFESEKTCKVKKHNQSAKGTVSIVKDS